MWDLKTWQGKLELFVLAVSGLVVVAAVIYGLSEAASRRQSDSNSTSVSTGLSPEEQQALHDLLLPPTETAPQPESQLEQLYDQLFSPPATDTMVQQNSQPTLGAFPLELAPMDVPDAEHMLAH